MEVWGQGWGGEILAGVTREALSDKTVFVQRPERTVGESCVREAHFRPRDPPVPRPWGGICLVGSVCTEPQGCCED